MPPVPSAVDTATRATPATTAPSRRPLALLLAGFALGTALAQSAGVEALGYLRAAVDHGAAWRLLTASFVHLSTTHWAINLAGWIAVLAVWGPRVGPARLAALGLALAPLHFLAAHALELLDWGAGFSGPLHGMVAAAGIELARRDDPALRRFGRLTLTGLAAKLAADAVLDLHATSLHAFPVAHALHWVAVAAAVAMVVALAPGSRRRSTPVDPA